MSDDSTIKTNSFSCLIANLEKSIFDHGFGSQRKKVDSGTAPSELAACDDNFVLSNGNSNKLFEIITYKMCLCSCSF